MNIDAILSFISVMILSGVGIYVYMKGINRISESFLRLLFFLLLWAAGNAMAAQSRTWGSEEGVIFWDNVLFLGVSLVPAAWFHLACIFTGVIRKKTYLFPVYAFATLFFIFYVSGSLSFYPHTQDPGLLHPTGLYWFFVAGSFVVILAGVAQYVIHYEKTSGKERKQALVMVVSAIFPIMGNLLYNSYLMIGTPLDVDPTIPSFAISGIMFAYGITYLSLFEVTIFDPSFITTLFENLHDAVFFLTRKGTLSIVNPEAEILTGCTKEELRIMVFEDLIHRQDKDMARKIVDEAMEGRSLLKAHEFRIERKDGIIVHVEATCKPLKKEREMIGAICVLRDISERKRNEKKLSTIYDLSEEITLTVDLNKIFEKVLDACENVLNFEMVGLYLIDEKENELYMKASRGYPEESRGFRLSLDEEKGMIISCIRRRETVCVPDTSKDELFIEGTMAMQSEIAIPLMIGEKIIGVLNIKSERPDAFSGEDRKLLETLSSQTAIAIQNAQLYEEIRSRAERIAVVNRIAKAVGATLRLEDLMEIVYKEITTFFRADVFVIALHDENAKEIFIPFSVDEGVRNPPQRIPLGVGLTSKVIIEKEILLVDDLRKEQDHLPPTQLFGTMKLPISWLGVPMIIGNRVTGVISVQSYRPHTWDEDDKLFLYTIADQIAVALENARLFEETQHEIAERKQAEQIQSVLYQIANATNTTDDLGEFYKSIRAHLATILDTTNFGIALYDKDTENVSLPYRVSEKDEYTSFHAGKSLTSYVIKKDKPLLATWKEIEELEKAGEVEHVGTPSKVWLGVPLRIGKEIIGAVTVQSYTDASLYTEKDLKILEFVSGQIAIAIQRKKAEEEARRRTTELAVLNELAQALTAHLSVEDVLKEAYRQISRLMDTTNFYIALYDPENNVINFALNVTESEVDRQALTVIPADQGISGYIIKNRKSVLLEENITEKLERMGIKILGGVPLSWLGVPLIVGEKILGVMAAQSYTVPRAYDEHDRELLTSIANQTAIAIQNAQLYEQVAKSNKLKEMFISIMSHDIKNPLAIIRGYNELLQDIVEEKAKAYSRKIEESVVKINDMIDTARLYSKMKDESYLREFMDVGLGDIIESSIKSLSDKAAQKNISVYFDRKNPTIGANKTLENVFLNLLDNAIKYSPPGSNVEIEIEEKEDTAKVTVKDHGKGIPDEFKEKIFDKFERGRVEGIEGSGLGLAIAREIVLRHSGKIWVENNRPQGSVFCVELPISH